MKRSQVLTLQRLTDGRKKVSAKNNAHVTATNQEQEGSDRNIRARAKNTFSELPALETEKAMCKTIRV